MNPTTTALMEQIFKRDKWLRIWSVIEKGKRNGSWHFFYPYYFIICNPRYREIANKWKNPQPSIILPVTKKEYEAFNLGQQIPIFSKLNARIYDQIDPQHADSLRWWLKFMEENPDQKDFLTGKTLADRLAKHVKNSGVIWDKKEERILH